MHRRGLEPVSMIIVTAWCFAVVLGLVDCTVPDPAFAEESRDLYFNTQGIPQGPAAPAPHETVYSRIGSSDSRSPRLVRHTTTYLLWRICSGVADLSASCWSFSAWQRKARPRASL